MGVLVTINGECGGGNKTHSPAPAGRAGLWGRVAEGGLLDPGNVERLRERLIGDVANLDG